MPGNPQVDFHILNPERNDQDVYLSRLVEEIYLQEHLVFILTASLDDSERMDECLWTFQNSSFLPHHIISKNAGHAPILISHSELPKYLDVLINLTHSVPSFYAKFHRIIEIVSGPESARAVSRQKYKQYKLLGCQIESFKSD